MKHYSAYWAYRNGEMQSLCILADDRQTAASILFGHLTDVPCCLVLKCNDVLLGD